MKLNATSRMTNIETQVRNQIGLETAPVIDKMLDFVIDHYTLDEFEKIIEVFEYDYWGWPEPSAESYEVAASIWDILPDHVRIRLLDLEASLKSFSKEYLIENLGAHKSVEGAGQSAPTSID